MKVRTDFITNSSSAAFIVRIDYLTCKQRTQLNDIAGPDTGWSITDVYPVIFGSTTMDNFDMENFLKRENFPMKKIHFFHSNDRKGKSTYLKSMDTCDCEWCKLLREVENEGKK